MFVQDQMTQVTPQKEVLAAMIDYKDKGIQTRTLVNTSAGSMKLLAFDQGAKLKEHTAPHDVHVLVLEGEAEIIIQGQSYQLQAEEIMKLPAKQPHAVEAKTRTKMLLTMFRT